MKEELKGPTVEDVAIAIVKEKGEDNIDVFNAYLINYKDATLEGVFVTSRGYGINRSTNEEIETSKLRHFLDIVQGKTFKKIEPIMEDVFGLNNEFWISFFLDNKMYDKKYVFLPETIKESHLRMIDLIEKPGIILI
jgi:hypothetical protein